MYTWVREGQVLFCDLNSTFFLQKIHVRISGVTVVNGDG